VQCGKTLMGCQKQRPGAARRIMDCPLIRQYRFKRDRIQNPIS
jgi:hypothetical protein